MTILAKPKPTITRTNRGRGHSYRIDGQPAPGVTTILNAVVNKPALVGWAARTVAEYVANKDANWLEDLRADGDEALIDYLKGVPDRVRNSAGDRGTQVHALAERAIAGEEVEETEELAPVWGHIESCVRFLDEWHVDPVLIEAVVANRTVRYCGTVDLVADCVQGRCMFDYKTSSIGIFPETALQLAAYLHAETYLDETLEGEPSEESLPGLQIDGGAYAVHLTGDGYEVRPIETAPAWEAFQHVAAVYHAGVPNGWSAWVRPAVTL